MQTLHQLNFSTGEALCRDEKGLPGSFETKNVTCSVCLMIMKGLADG